MKKQEKEKKGKQKASAEGQDGWSSFRERLPHISADALKRFCCAVILVQTATTAILENGLLHVNQYTPDEFSAMLEEDASMASLASAASVLEMICGLAVPILAFLLVEGFIHTSNYTKYFTRVVIFAFLSEAPYDLAVSGKLIDGESQNPLWTMAIALLMLYYIRLLRGGEDPSNGKKDQSRKETGGLSGAPLVILEILIVVAALILATMLESELGIVGILLVAVYYLLYDRTLTKIIVGMIVSIMTFSGPLGAYGIMCYSGERKNSWSKYVYYVFYPVQLLLFGGIALLL